MPMGEGGDVLTKDGARQEPDTGDNKNHPALKQIANLKECNIYVSRIDWTTANETKIAQISGKDSNEVPPWRHPA